MMKLAHRTKGTVAILCGVCCVSLLAPACGDDDDCGTDEPQRGGGGSGAKAGSGGANAGAGGTPQAGGGGAPVGGSGGAIGGTGPVGGGAGTGPVEAGRGGTSQGGTNAAGAGGTPEGGMGGAGGAGTGEGGSGGAESTPPPGCIDGCLELFLPFDELGSGSGIGPGSTHFTVWTSAHPDFSQTVVTARLRVFEGTQVNGALKLYVTGADGSPLPNYPNPYNEEGNIPFSDLADWTDVVLNVAAETDDAFDPTNVLALTIRVAATEPGPFDHVRVAVESVNFTNYAGDNFTFTPGTTDWFVNSNAGNPYPESAIALLPPG